MGRSKSSVVQVYSEVCHQIMHRSIGSNATMSARMFNLAR
ncbi:hypothetical protein MGWOODY_XGa2909 [hydrothermal vent metagenome]|uniref:Uncharacterized protein n=1 Tax=hydrothermal vent metagenome TaxID=652676 RepID=A0A160TU20_9ZZZZ